MPGDRPPPISGITKENLKKMEDKKRRPNQGEVIDRKKMDRLKEELDQYVYDDNAEKLIFGDGSKQPPKYKIFIPKDDWKKLKKKYQETDPGTASRHKNKYLKLALSDLIDKYKISIPYKRISLEEAKEDFVSLAHDPELFSHLSTRHQELKNKKREKKKKLYSLELIRKSPVYYRFDFNYPVVDPNDKRGYFIKQSNDGMKSSNYFHLDTRLDVGSRHNPMGAVEAWKDKKYRKVILDAFWTMDNQLDYVDTTKMKTALNVRHYVASQFRPAAAKCIYRLFDAENVFDPSMGWGDRLVGFLATPHTKKYVGTDPNIKLHTSYVEQLDLYGTALESVYGIKKKVEHLKQPCEEVDFEKYKNQMDVIFTSPPYFDTEHYSDDEGQSFLNYDNLDSWLTGFMFKVIEGCWKMLRDGGILAINITDQKLSPTKVNKICDPMNDFISNQSGASYVGCLGLQMSQRPGQGSSTAPKNTTFGEPIWIWGKNVNGKTLEEYIFDKSDYLFKG